MIIWHHIRDSQKNWRNWTYWKSVVGTFKVWANQQNGKLLNVIETMRLKNLSLLALSDVQWQGSGVLELKESTIIFSPLDEKRSSGGVEKQNANGVQKKWDFQLSIRKTFESEVAVKKYIHEHHCSLCPYWSRRSHWSWKFLWKTSRFSCWKKPKGCHNHTLTLG